MVNVHAADFMLKANFIL